MADRFLIPKKRLQKPVIMKGSSLLESIPDYIDILKHTRDIKAISMPCRVPTSPALGASEAIRSSVLAKRALTTVRKIDRERQKILRKNFELLNTTKKKLLRDVEKIEHHYFQNLKYRENDKLETLTKIEGYIESAREIKSEKEKQDILIRIGLIVEALMQDLAPYEEILGRLSLQENAFKSKADTLAIKKHILTERMGKLNGELKKDLLECEDLKKHLFKISFKLRENTHFNLNLINKLTEVDTRSMRAVLDMEYKLTKLREKSYQVQAENAWLFWFLDWVLFDVIGTEMLTGISKKSSPQDKAQCIIDSYKNVRIMLAQRESIPDPTIVDNVFN